MLTAQKLVEQMNEPEKSKDSMEKILSKEELELRILNEIISQYKKITDIAEVLGIDQRKLREVSKKEIEERFNSLEKKINYSRDINFFIAVFSMLVITVLVTFLLIKQF